MELCIQDGSDLNYNSLDQCEGLGVIGSVGRAPGNRCLYPEADTKSRRGLTQFGKCLSWLFVPLILGIGEKINTKDTDLLIQWQDGSGDSVEIGYLNPNGQQCCGHCGVPGSDHGQYAY